jgi:hypothetical protein
VSAWRTQRAYGLTNGPDGHWGDRAACKGDRTGRWDLGVGDPTRGNRQALGICLYACPVLDQCNDDRVKRADTGRPDTGVIVAGWLCRGPHQTRRAYQAEPILPRDAGAAEVQRAVLDPGAPYGAASFAAVEAARDIAAGIGTTGSAAARIGCSESLVRRAVLVARRRPDLIAAVLAGEVSFRQAIFAAKATP